MRALLIKTTPPLCEEGPHFQTCKWFWKDQNYGLGFRRSPKPRKIVLARTISNLLLCYVVFFSCTYVLFSFYLCGGTLGTAATRGLLYQPRMIGEGDCGEIGGMKISSRNRSTRKKSAPAPLCPP
jgi:hypothetical protein